MIRKYRDENGYRLLVFGRKSFKLIEIEPGPHSKISQKREFRVFFRSLGQKDELVKIFGKEFSVSEKVRDGGEDKGGIFVNDSSLIGQMGNMPNLGFIKVSAPFDKFLDCLKRNRQYRVCEYIGNARFLIR